MVVVVVVVVMVVAVELEVVLIGVQGCLYTHSWVHTHFVLLVSVWQCPVFDLDHNIDFEGRHQTMTNQAAIFLQVHPRWYPGGDGWGGGGGWSWKCGESGSDSVGDDEDRVTGGEDGVEDDVNGDACGASGCEDDKESVDFDGFGGGVSGGDDNDEGGIDVDEVNGGGVSDSESDEDCIDNDFGDDDGGGVSCDDKDDFDDDGVDVGGGSTGMLMEVMAMDSGGSDDDYDEDKDGGNFDNNIS